MIFLVRLTQLKIGYGWESMAYIWNSTDLRKPLSIAKPSIHSLNAVLELTLGRRRCAASAPPVKYGTAGKKSVMECSGKPIGGDLK